MPYRDALMARRGRFHRRGRKVVVPLRLSLGPPSVVATSSVVAASCEDVMIRPTVVRSRVGAASWPTVGRPTATAWSAVRPRGGPGRVVLAVVALAVVMVLTLGRVIPCRSILVSVQKRNLQQQMEGKGSANALWSVLFAHMTTSSISVLSSVVRSHLWRTVLLRTTMVVFSIFKLQMSMT
jgi:hypothetical protein